VEAAAAETWKKIHDESARKRAAAGGDPETAAVGDGPPPQLSVAEVQAKIAEELPPILGKLLGPYELRCFYWEIFECVRKILLVGFPVFFTPGSQEQLVFTLITCYLTSCAYTAFKPFRDGSDSLLQEIAQFEVFFAILSSIIRRCAPSAPGSGRDDTQA
jgi:hypothetical protein